MFKLNETDKKWVDEIWSRIDAKLEYVAPLNKDKIPYITVDGVYNNMAEDDITWWTNGFWPGLMWLMYVGTKKEIYREAAERAEELLEGAFSEYERLHHDVGFMWLLSSGVNYRLFGGKKSKNRLSLAADILSGRYNPDGRYIRAWNEDKVGWVIIDCMMNINLLYHASEIYDDPRFRKTAMHHADTVMRTHIRPDGSANHIVDLDPDTGEAVEAFGGQGYGLGSSWSRGQAWALYGYILSYIHTGKAEYLDTAKRCANYFIANVCDDWLPRADFRSPAEPVIYDSTAGACAACGLLEIARNVPEHESGMYLNAAMELLKAMEREFCDWSREEQGILLMGTEAYHSRPERKHIAIIYGTYFFTEAIYKLKGFDMLFW